MQELESTSWDYEGEVLRLGEACHSLILSTSHSNMYLAQRVAETPLFRLQEETSLSAILLIYGFSIKVVLQNREV